LTFEHLLEKHEKEAQEKPLMARRYERKAKPHLLIEELGFCLLGI
jgi:hypothetical protein